MLRYAKPLDPSSLSIYVNGSKIKQTLLPAVGVEWDSWGEKTENLTLVAGANTIAYSYDTGDGGNLNLDCIRVEGVANTAPVAAPQTLATNAGTAKAITLSATDAENQPLTYVVTVPPTNGALSGVAPNLTYTPNANYSGPDSFSFKANDGALDSNVATISLTVNPITLTGLTLAPNVVNGGASSVGTVTLSSAAPSGGKVVTLSSNSSAATVPATVTVPAGATSATFNVTTTIVAVPTSATITATFNGSSIPQTLSINAPCVYF